MGGTTSAPTTATPQCDVAFPPEVVRCIASFLLGVEVIQYAHASPVLFATLNTPEVWTSRADARAPLNTTSHGRIQAPSWCCPAKAAYLQLRSLFFRGPKPPNWFSLARTPPCGDFLPLPSLLLGRMGECTLELTFCVSPERPGASTCHGGILVGFQDIVCAETSSVSLRAGSLSLVAIDSDAGLHVNADPMRCSALGPAAQLTFDRWHHLLVVFHRRHAEAYLDGKLCFSSAITRWFRWLVPQYGQIGTGLLRDAFPSKPVTWQPFHGLLAEARVLKAALNADEASRRARGESCVAPEKIRDLMDGDAVHRAQGVVTSRPCERYARVLLRR